MTILETLQKKHDVTLLTLTHPDFEEVNNYYNTNVDTSNVNVKTMGTLAPYVHEKSGERMHVLKNSMASRLVNKRSNYFDLIIGTFNEFTCSTRSIQYIHLPQFRRWMGHDESSHNNSIYKIYDRLCKEISGFDYENIRSHTLLANSEWTANVTDQAYGVKPEVVYPPVDTSEFISTKWNERENGFVTVGRVVPGKNILRSIEIVKRLNERGHDTHLHVVGPPLDKSYAKQVTRKAKQTEGVHIEGEVSRKRLVELISTHKYGIHGMDHEHFGMAVGELAAGGTIPFVPNGGGQREIVHEREELLYESADEAVEKIDHVLSDPELRRELRDQLGDIEERFGRKRFKRTIRETVEQTLR
ncbi:glycosyltransferase family 4 protein [Natrinema gari]|nr:glycosyltransferase family 4 protein [Natrinema gari]